MSLQKLDIEIRRGETINLPIRVESGTLVYKAVTAIPQTAPVRLTVTGHGCAEGWRGALTNIKGPVALNYTSLVSGAPPSDEQLRPMVVVDANTVEFNGINAAGLPTYVSGGQLVFYAPLDLSTFTIARLHVKNKVGGTLLTSFTTTDGTLEIDAATRSVWIRLTDEASAALSFSKGVFDLELETAAGVVKAVCLATSTLTILPEVTTPI
jgi:hypothetical protein